MSFHQLPFPLLLVSELFYSSFSENFPQHISFLNFCSFPEQNGGILSSLSSSSSQVFGRQMKLCRVSFSKMSISTETLTPTISDNNFPLIGEREQQLSTAATIKSCHVVMEGGMGGEGWQVANMHQNMVGIKCNHTQSNQSKGHTSSRDQR